MIIDQSHRSWALSILFATVVAALIYIYQVHPEWLPFLPQPALPPLDIHPGRTRLGLIYGSMALAIFLFSALLGWRRKRPALRIGRVQSWLRAHIWLSVFTIPLVLMHAGFITGGPMTTLLLIIYAVVMISGFFGLALQQFLPHMMMENIPFEAIYEQIPHIRAQLLAKTLEIRDALLKPPAPIPVAVTAGAPELTPAPVAVPVFPPAAIQRLNETILPYLETRNGKRHILGNIQTSNMFFRRLRIEVPKEFEGRVTELEAICHERRLLDLQTTYQHWLHGWLIVHVPFSLVLLILTVWHAVVAQFFS